MGDGTAFGISENGRLGERAPDALTPMLSSTNYGGMKCLHQINHRRSKHYAKFREDVESLPEYARGGLNRSNVGNMGPRAIADQCCAELLDITSMVSMVENAIDASDNLPVEMDGTMQVLSYVQHQLNVTFKLLNDCLPFIEGPEVQS